MARSRISPACSATSAPRRARRWPRRAPLDLRVNTLKATRDEAARSLADLAPEPTRWSPHGLRIKLRADAKNPAVHAEFAYLKGLIEIQDEGSQLAALLAGAKPGEQVLDLCAGGGGKTLALAAIMENKGQIYATDDDKRRLAPIHDRLERSGARNVQVRTPKSVGNELADLEGKLDLVLIDAPCTGIGAWRRNPGRQMAGAARRAGGARQGAGRDARARRRRWSSRAAASPMSPARCWTRKTARRSATSSRRHPDFSVEKPAEVANALGERAYLFQPGGADLGRRPADDAAPDRHRRVFRQPPAALCMTSAGSSSTDSRRGLRTRHGHHARRQDSHRRFRLPGDAAHRAPGARGEGLLRDRAVPEGRRGLRAR